MDKLTNHCFRPAKGAEEQGVPINMYGYSAVYSAPPTLTDEHEVQRGNINPTNKIKLKESREIKSNYLGCSTTRMPRLPENDYSLLLPANLIDGNDQTCWSSHFHTRPDEYPVWIRIDLAKETEVKKIIIKKRPVKFDRFAYAGSYLPQDGAEEIGRAMAKKITIKVSKDAYSWETVFDGEVDRDNLDVFEFPINTSCKQLLIIGNDMAPCENWCYSFSVACIEVLDQKGENAALHSRGAGVTTNSIHHMSQNERGVDMHNWYLQMDLGFKWARVGYHDDPINWHFVEKEKGIYKMDPIAEEAINILCENDINIIYCLNYGNRLYEGYEERRFPQLNEWYYETPYPPTSDEALEAWEKYVKFSVNYYKDKVKYFEIWNEWNGPTYWGDTPNADNYIRLAKRTIPIIRECAPDCKIVLGSFNQFVHEATADNCNETLAMFFKAIRELGPMVDAIGYHPFYQPDIAGDQYINYPQNIKNFKKYCESYGFRGDMYMASEFAVGAMYPPTLKGAPGCWYGDGGEINFSEIQKAKIVTQLNVRHTALGVQSIVCELCNNDYTLELSLLRKCFDSAPVQFTAPSAAYYATRNTCTVFDEYEKADFEYTMSARDNIEAYAFEKPSCFALSLWQTHIVSDYCSGLCIDICLPCGIKQAFAVNLIDGETTELIITHENGKCVLKNIIVRDAPLFIEMEK